ncbi:MAG: helix-turn-helix domain-containing protein [Desulfobacteraceae bacterium]|jgi:IclR family pca regulon transcriptional regulator|nr:helix-turn-helix domain-containing protein [Desulfobacteraceae bacterium]
MQNTPPTDRYFVHSLGRGLRYLERLAESETPLSLSQIAEALGHNRATAFRFLHTLEKLEFVERDPVVKSYRVSPKVLKLGYSVFRGQGLWQTAHPYLERASRKTGETFNLAILDGDQILYIDRVKTGNILNINLEIGSKLPAYCTSMGRVLLAALPEETARQILRHSKRKRVTERTVTGLKELMDILRRVRLQGYAVNNGELAPELVSAAAPVQNREGRVVAALNVAVRATDYPDSPSIQTLFETVVSVAGQISQAMGHYNPEGGDAGD